MQRKYDAFAIVLTYRPEHLTINPLAYEEYWRLKDEAGMRKTLQFYKREAGKHLDNLKDSIEAHVRTKKGKSWEGEIKAVVSCFNGSMASDAIALKALTNNKATHQIEFLSHFPDRLHVHALVKGIPATTITDWVVHYWRKRHGMVKNSPDEVPGNTPEETEKWFHPYADGQKLCVRNIHFGAKR